MALTAGSRLAEYEILALIGAGGMGEVYRARDTKLGREVAIKVLPEAFSQNKERLARFEREARLLASLNHPGIATLHGFEKHDDVRFLVMELVEGETLEARIEKGPIAIEEALPLFLQMAEAMEAAHNKGVVHRDLKPANIKITPDGRPKILDFGLAKGYATPESNVSQSPTLTRGTSAGIILGTAPYMSPEQARGKSLDNPGTMTAWMAGAGIQGGQVIGASDEFGYKAQEQPISVHDLHATMLHLLGMDHKKLTYRFNGRDMRLTDVGREVGASG